MIWNELFNDSKNKVIWQPYNVSERIINVVLFWNFLKENNLLTNKDNKKLENFIITHLRKLIYNIEYPATGIVNNHLINNARAFYLAGCFINNDSIINLGKEVLYNIIPKIISDNGVLNESSVHYQLLITRSICEIKIISSDQKDKTFYNWITKIAKLMNSQSLIMIPPNISNNNNIPRIGDISPDISIDWYLPNTTKYKTGWNKLWNYKGSYSYDKNANNNYVTNGWLIWENAIWWLISFLHPDKDFYPKGHGHEDYSSFCLYYNSEPLFIDIGRISYDKILLKKGISGREAKYHNCILIDGQAILNKNNYHLSKKKEYLFPNFIRWQVNNNKITYNRLISNSETLITIEDQFIIGDSKHHTIEGRFNIDAYWSIELIKDNKIYIINKNNIKLIIKFSGTNCINIINTNDFPQYGVERVIKSIVWKYKTTGEKNFNVKTEVMVYNG